MNLSPDAYQTMLHYVNSVSSNTFFINTMMMLHKFSNEKDIRFLLKLKPNATNSSICYVRCMAVFLKNTSAKLLQDVLLRNSV